MHENVRELPDLDPSTRRRRPQHQPSQQCFMLDYLRSLPRSLHRPVAVVDGSLTKTAIKPRCGCGPDAVRQDASGTIRFS
jgi:hypothetical protein